MADENQAVQGGDAGVTWTPDQVHEVLRGVFDPELHMNIVDLGLIYNVQVRGEEIDVQMTLTSPGCPYGPYLIHQVKDTLLRMDKPAREPAPRARKRTAR